MENEKNDQSLMREEYDERSIGTATVDAGASNGGNAGRHATAREEGTLNQAMEAETAVVASDNTDDDRSVMSPNDLPNLVGQYQPPPPQSNLAQSQGKTEAVINQETIPIQAATGAAEAATLPPPAPAAADATLPAPAPTQAPPPATATDNPAATLPPSATTEATTPLPKSSMAYQTRHGQEESLSSSAAVFQEWTQQLQSNIDHAGAKPVNADIATLGNQSGNSSAPKGQRKLTGITGHRPGNDTPTPDQGQLADAATQGNIPGATSVFTNLGQTKLAKKVAGIDCPSRDSPFTVSPDKRSPTTEITHQEIDALEAKLHPSTGDAITLGFLDPSIKKSVEDCAQVENAASSAHQELLATTTRTTRPSTRQPHKHDAHRKLYFLHPGRELEPRIDGDGREEEKEEITAPDEQRQQDDAVLASCAAQRPGAYFEGPGHDLLRAQTVNYFPVRSLPQNNSASPTQNGLLDGNPESWHRGAQAGADPTNIGTSSDTVLPLTSTPTPSMPGWQGLSYSTSLVEAKLIAVEAQDSLPRATELDLESKQNKKSRPWQFICQVFAVGMVAVSVIVLLAVLLTIKVDDGAPSTNIPQPNVHTSSPTISQEAYIKSLLPRHTLQVIENDHTSPQYNAFQFILQELQAWDYPDERILQRFALATFYHAVGGDGWKVNHGWLESGTHECEWFSPVPKLDIIDRYNGTIVERVHISDSPCEGDVYQHLTQYGNNINGTLPPEVFELLPSLISVNLDPQGTTELFNTVDKWYYFGSPYVITGSLPTEIGLCSQLQYLSMDYQRLSGTLPSSLGQLSLLKQLRLYDNRLTGTIPSGVGHMTSLNSLELGHDALYGAIPSEIGLLSSLTSLDLLVNDLTGTIPSEIALLASLTALDLAGNELNGTIPSKIWLLSSLTSLVLYFTLLTGPIPSEIGRISSLELLYLFATHLTGTIPSEIWLMSSLMCLDLSSPGLTGTIPSEIGLMTGLIELDLYQTGFTGTIPSEIGLMSSLEYLYILATDVTGTIPSEIGLLSSLTWLDLSNTTLTGTIPTELGQLSQLSELHLSDNSLTGSIPTEFGLLSSVPCVYLSNNLLTGAVPTELGQLTHLSVLDLSNNTLTGSIPQEVRELCDLSAVLLLFEGNNLTDADSESNLCSWWPGETPQANSTHELIINIQHDEWPEETTWLFQENLLGDCILSSCNGTSEGEWNTVLGTMPVEPFGQVSISQTLNSETFYRFSLRDDFLDFYAWATITAGAEGNATEEIGNSVLWSAGLNNVFVHGTVVCLWVDGNGHIEVVENGANKC